MAHCLLTPHLGNSWIQPWLFQSWPIGTLVSKMHSAKMTELSDKAMCIVQHIPCMGDYSNLIGYYSNLIGYYEEVV